MIDHARHLVAAFGAVLVLVCWPVWQFAGMLAKRAGFDDLDLVVRLVVVFGFLTLVEAVSERLFKT